MSKSGHLVVKYKKGKEQFEILCKPGSVEPYREGKLGIDKCLVAEEIFKNASKFTKVKNTDLKKSFGTDNKMQCIKTILEEGQFQLTKKEIAAKVAQNKQLILNYINKYYHDPTKEPTMPHPITRLETVIDQMNYNIDHTTPYMTQTKEIIKKLPDFLRIKPMNPPHLEMAAEQRQQRKEAQSNKFKNSGGNQNKNKKDRKSGKKNRY